MYLNKLIRVMDGGFTLEGVCTYQDDRILKFVTNENQEWTANIGPCEDTIVEVLN